jgi:hypothetical protein
VQCHEVIDERELDQIFALRYAVYVEEMGRSQRYADHERRRLAEPLDETAIHLAAYQSDEVLDADSRGVGRRLVGALRIHLPECGDLSELAWLHPDACKGGAVRTGIVSRLVTDKSVRGGGGSAGLQLAIAAYRIGLRERLDVVEIDCHESLVPYFEWLGFDVLRRFCHESFGDVAVMRMQPFDRARLRRTDSPFLPILDQGTWESEPCDDSTALEGRPGRVRG